VKRLTVLFIIISIAISSPAPIYSQEAEKTSALFISVDDVRLIAANNNLDIKLARLDSKIKGTDLSYKEAVFDTILNGTIDYTDDQRKTASSLYGSRTITNNYNVGMDKKLRTGTDVEIDFTNKREWSDSTFISTNPYHESEMAISITQPIAKNFFGLIDRGNIGIVKHEIKNAELDSYIKIEDAIISTEKAYWNLVLIREQVKAKKATFKKSIRLFNQYRRKLKIGLVETGDALAAEANMHIRESDLLLVSNDLKTAEELLRLKLNIKNGVRLYPSDTLYVNYFDASLKKSLMTAFKNRRDYVSNKNTIEAKNINLKMKSNSRLPEIDLKATFAQNGISGKYYRALSDVFEDSNPKYYLAVEFEYPLENNLANSEYEKATLEKAKAIINLQKTERQIILDIDNSIRNLYVNKANISKMERAENLQKGKLFQEEKKFKYGRSDSDTLIRYQGDLLNAILMTKKAYFDYRVSILDVLAAEDSFLEHIGLE